MAATIRAFSSDPSFGFEALRAASYANFGGADVGEVIAICSHIPPGNEDAWLREWRAAAERAEANAKIARAKGNVVSAREALLRASNYYRVSEFYRRKNPAEDELSEKLYDLSASCFYAAVELFPSYGFEKVSIPYESTTLPGFFMFADKTGKPRPTIIFNGGFDSTMEESWFAIGAAALERGFNVLAFDGPGQGQALRKQKLHFRADWENVITPVVSYALARDEVAEDKLVISGWSMGGYLVTQAATREHRAAALILNDGVFDFASVYRKHTPAIAWAMIQNHWDTTMGALFWVVKRLSTGVRWALLNSKWSMGFNSESEVIREVSKYTVGDAVGKIVTPTLVLDAPDDQFLKGQPQLLYSKLKCEKKLVSLTREEGGSVHCHMGAFTRLNQVIFDFLFERLSLD